MPTATPTSHSQRPCPDDALWKQMMKHALVFLSAFCRRFWLAPRMPRTARRSRITGNHDNNAPINISSDNFQADLNAKSGTCTGNVHRGPGRHQHARQPGARPTVNGKADKIYAKRQCGGGFAHLRHGDRRQWRLFGRPAHRGDDRTCRAEEGQECDAGRTTHRQSRHRPGKLGGGRREPGKIPAAASRACSTPNSQTHEARANEFS